MLLFLLLVLIMLLLLLPVLILLLLLQDVLLLPLPQVHFLDQRMKDLGRMTGEVITSLEEHAVTILYCCNYLLLL